MPLPCGVSDDTCSNHTPQWENPITLSYYAIPDGVDIKLDAYLPRNVHGPTPAVLFFHGGGCFSGTRRNEGIGYFPWIEQKTLERGYLFITTDYRLLHPFTGLDQRDDAIRLLHFLGHEFNERLPAGATMTLDPTKIAVIGESGGGYIARLAALHAVPRPAALVSYYGMGGDLLSDFWLNVREPQTMPRERVDRFLDTKPTEETGLPIFLQDGFFTDALRRTDAFAWISQNGLFLDYLTGIPGLSEGLREVEKDQRPGAIPTHVQQSFPELSMNTSLPHPPALFVHSTNDTVVPLSESLNTHQQLKKAGVRTEVFLLDGEKHGPIQQDGSEVVGMEKAEEKVFQFIDSVFRDREASRAYDS